MKKDGKPPLKMGGNGRSEARDPTDEALATLDETGSGMAAPGMQRFDLGFQQAVAVTVPRDLKKIEHAILYEAAEMGEDFIYGWEQNDKESPTGKSRIEGLSIDGAMIMLRNWGNCGCIPTVTKETPNAYYFSAAFVDIEKGFTIQRLYRKAKAGVAGRYSSERAEDTAFQIGQSKAIRNAIKAAMPSWLIDKAIDAAKLNAAKKYTPASEHIGKVVDYAKSIGVSKERLIFRAGKPIDEWTPYDIVIVRSVFKAIAKGETSAAAEFPEPASDGLAAKTEPAPPPTVSTPPPAETAAQSPPTTSPAPEPASRTPEQLEAEEADRALAAREAAEAQARAGAAGFEVPGFAKAPGT